MLRSIILILLVLWLLGLVFKIAMGLAWVLLIIAVVIGIADFMKRRSMQA